LSYISIYLQLIDIYFTDKLFDIEVVFGKTGKVVLCKYSDKTGVVSDELSDKTDKLSDKTVI
jgi:hypothetical protein